MYMYGCLNLCTLPYHPFCIQSSLGWMCKNLHFLSHLISLTLCVQLPKEVFNVLKLYNTQQQRLQSTNTTESQDGTRHTQPNALLQCASENDGTLLQPLQLEPSMTLMELTMKVSPNII